MARFYLRAGLGEGAPRGRPRAFGAAPLFTLSHWAASEVFPLGVVLTLLGLKTYFHIYMGSINHMIYHIRK